MQSIMGKETEVIPSTSFSVDLNTRGVKRVGEKFWLAQVESSQDEETSQKLAVIAKLLECLKRNQSVRATANRSSSGEILTVNFKDLGEINREYFESMVLAPLYPKDKQSKIPERILKRMGAGGSIVFMPPGHTVFCR